MNFESLKTNFIASPFIKITKDALFYLKKEDLLKINPFFIVGCGHSGTSIMLAILAQHSKIYGIPYESHLFCNDFHKYSLLKRLIAWQKECDSQGKTYWIEKTPRHLFYLEKIFELCPRAKVILMIRDGRDVVCSLNARFNNFEYCLETWLTASEIALKHLNNKRVKVVKLEDLIADPELILEDTLQFLGERYEDSILRFYERPKYYYSQNIIRPQSCQDGEDHCAYRNWQINQPLYKSTIRWPTEMAYEEKVMFKQKAQKYLVKFDYVHTNDW